jgi:hypothetical protein
MTELFEKVAPLGPGLRNSEDGIDEQPIVLGGHAEIFVLVRQKVLDPFSMCIRDRMARKHGGPSVVRDKRVRSLPPSPIYCPHDLSKGKKAAYPAGGLNSFSSAGPTRAGRIRQDRVCEVQQRCARVISVEVEVANFREQFERCDLLDQLVHRGAQQMLQQAIELEAPASDQPDCIDVRHDPLKPLPRQWYRQLALALFAWSLPMLLVVIVSSRGAERGGAGWCSKNHDAVWRSCGSNSTSHNGKSVRAKGGPDPRVGLTFANDDR